MKSGASRLNHWQAHITAQKDSGLSIQNYCNENNLKKHQFAYYKKRIQNHNTMQAKPKLVPIVVAEAKPTQPLKLKINSVLLEFEDSVPPRWVAEVLREMGRLP